MNFNSVQTSARVGLISDTHGLLRPEAVAALAGSDLIIHAGDIGTLEVLDELRAIAPVLAVRGNNDKGAWASHIPPTAAVSAGMVRIYVIHDLEELDADVLSGRFQVVVSGHTHRPAQEWRDGLLWVNPGSAGPRRFRLPIALGKLEIRGRHIDVALQELCPAAHSTRK